MCVYVCVRERERAHILHFLRSLKKHLHDGSEETNYWPDCSEFEQTHVDRIALGSADPFACLLARAHLSQHKHTSKELQLKPFGSSYFRPDDKWPVVAVVVVAASVDGGAKEQQPANPL